MTRRIARQLVRLYPRVWRARYEEEFVALLEAREITWRDATDVACSATREWLRVRWVAIGLIWPLTMWATAALCTIGFAALASFVVGVLRWTVGVEVPFQLWLVSRSLIASAFLGMPVVLAFGSLLAAPWLVLCRLTKLGVRLPRASRLLALTPFVYAGRQLVLSPEHLVGALAAGWMLSALARPRQRSAEAILQ